MILLLLAMLSQSTHAAVLTDQERKELMAKLDAIQQAADEKIDSRFRIAVQAYRQAITSDIAAMDLYLKCIEKVRFKDQLKDNSAFRDWKEHQEETLSDPGFKVALRYQLRWLILSIQASSKKADKAALGQEGMTLIDSIFGEIEHLQPQISMLSQSASSTVFAQAYEIGSLKSDWPQSPMNISQFFNEIIMPPLRNPSHIPMLRAAWIKRIKLEELIATNKEGKSNGGNTNKKGKKDREQIREAREEARDKHQLDQEKFTNEMLPGLLWEMEVDLFKSGDESGAAARMVAHIQKYLTHKSAGNWTKQLVDLLTPKPKAAPAPAPTPTEGSTETPAEPTAPVPGAP